MRPNRNVTITALIFAMVTVLVLPAQASEWELSPSSERQAIADVSVQPGVVTMTPNVPFKRVRLVISGPAGVVFDKLYTEAPITWHVEDLKGKALADGRYDFELRFDLGSVEKRPADSSDGPSLKAAPVEQSRAVSGAFSVKNGTIDTAYRSNLPKLDPEALRQPMEAPGLKAFDDTFLFVESKIGVGVDDSQITPKSALHIQENSPTGIILEERDGTPSAPGNIEGQWRILGTDTQFSIGHDPNDSGNERANFIIEENAEANALYMDSSGALGLGTSTPFGSLDIADPQNFVQLQFSINSGVDTVGGIEVGLSDLFKIEGAAQQDIVNININAPANSLNMSAAGLIGIGTTVPDRKLQVVGTDDATTRIDVVNNSGTTASRTLFKLTNNGTNRFAFENSATGDQWTFNDSGGNFLVAKVGTGVNEAIFAPGGNLTIAGTLSQGSSRAIKHDIEEVDSLDVLEALVDMPISMWSYNHDAGVRHLGPMAEDFHQTFGLGNSPKTISSIDTGGVALAAIKGLYGQVTELAERNSKLESENAELRQRLQAIEDALASLK
jgi:hypothetical protein